jgi:hypothetical protein
VKLVTGASPVVSRYGYLGLHREPGGFCKPETVAEWATEIARMREAVEVWGLWKKKDVEKLRARVRREGDVVQNRAPPELCAALGVADWDAAVHGDRRENAGPVATTATKGKKWPRRTCYRWHC